MCTSLLKPNFHGFMVDVASANYNGIRKVYSGDPNIPLEGKEYTYFMIGRKAYKSRQRI